MSACFAIAAQFCTHFMQHRALQRWREWREEARTEAALVDAHGALQQRMAAVLARTRERQAAAFGAAPQATAVPAAASSAPAMLAPATSPHTLPVPRTFQPPPPVAQPRALVAVAATASRQQADQARPAADVRATGVIEPAALDSQAVEAAHAYAVQPLHAFGSVELAPGGLATHACLFHQAAGGAVVPAVRIECGLAEAAQQAAPAAEESPAREELSQSEVRAGGSVSAC